MKDQIEKDQIEKDQTEKDQTEKDQNYIDPRAPVLVGVGLVQQKETDPLKAREPLALMIEAVKRSAHDACATASPADACAAALPADACAAASPAGEGAAALIAGIEDVYVPVGRWRYRNPGRLIADAVGAGNARSISALPGISQQTIISEACSSIASGKTRCALVVGGEAGNRILQAGIQGVELEDTVSTELADVVMKPHEEMLPDYEIDSGLGNMPVGYYAIIDSAYRYAKGQSIDERRDEMAARYSVFSEMARNNPQGWNDESYASDYIREHSAKNSMVAFPYTKLHNSSWNIDQASALLFCCAEEAQQLGIPRENWIFPRVFTEANHMVNLTAREALHRCPGAELAGRAAFDAAGIAPEELDFLELYTCFPVAQDVYAAESGIPADIDWSFTGAMPFAGGPFNSFVLHATAQLAHKLRSRPGSTGMVTTVSGVLTKQGFAVWGTAPATGGYRFIDVTEDVANASQPKEVTVDFNGRGSVAGYTVMYRKKTPQRGIVVADLPDGRRSIAYTEDPAVMAEMESREICGRKIDLKEGCFSFVS